MSGGLTLCRPVRVVLQRKSVYSDGSLIVVNTPGLYHCQLRASVSEDGAGVKEILRDSNIIQVVRIPDNVSQTSSRACNETPPPEERSEWGFNAVSATKAIFTARTC